MFYDLIKARKAGPSEERINQLLEELFSSDSERKGDEMDKGALSYLDRHKASARDALKGYGAEDMDEGDELEKAKGSEDEDERSEEREAMESEAEEQGELFEDEDSDKAEDEDDDEDDDEAEDEGEDMKKGDDMDAKAKRRDLMSRAYSIIDDLSDEQLDEFLSAREVKKAQVMGVLSRLTNSELADFCSVEDAQGAQGSEQISQS